MNVSSLKPPVAVSGIEEEKTCKSFATFPGFINPGKSHGDLLILRFAWEVPHKEKKTSCGLTKGIQRDPNGDLSIGKITNHLKHTQECSISLGKHLAAEGLHGSGASHHLIARFEAESHDSCRPCHRFILCSAAKNSDELAVFTSRSYSNVTILEWSTSTFFGKQEWKILENKLS